MGKRGWGREGQGRRVGTFNRAGIKANKRTHTHTLQEASTLITGEHKVETSYPAASVKKESWSLIDLTVKAAESSGLESNVS